MVDLLAAVAAGIVEGDYTSWTYRWTKTLTGGVNGDYFSCFIDEANEVVNVFWYTNDSLTTYFAIYNLSDGSEVYKSNIGVFYCWPGTVLYSHDTAFGSSKLYEAGQSRSLQSYLLIASWGYHDLEVWRGGAVPLWEHNIQDDEAGVTAHVGEISPTGKYILIKTSNDKLILYKGS